ncbi:MAG: hypothetical protein IKX62_06945 [Bacteroidales bacterium]|nr:hypothetical protein [Bacteroidales bacterium]
MKNKILLLLFALALGAPLHSQSINQSVQVTNDYLARFADFQKQGSQMQVPDSLFRFDYNFDYSVFDSPYRGSYEFSPYRIEVQPEARAFDGRDLYARFGAGYTFHPQLEFAWQTLLQDNYSFGVLAGLDGYSGKYLRRGVDGRFAGHDLSGRLGAAGRYLLPAVQLSYGMGYEGIYAGEDIAEPKTHSGFHSFLLSGRVASRERPEDVLFYDVDARFRFSSETNALSTGLKNAKENNLRVTASVGPVLDGNYRILLDALFELDALRDYDEMVARHPSANLVAFRPHAEFSLGPVRLDAGVRVDFTTTYATKDTVRQFSFAPDVTVRFQLPDTDAELYAAISGGQALQSLYDVKQLNHFAVLSGLGASASREKIRIRGGVQGHWGPRLQYEAEAGYASLADVPFASLYGALPASYKVAYGKVRGAWKDERLTLDGGLSFNYMQVFSGIGAFSPPAFTADLRGEYTWLRQVSAGAFLEAASSRLLIGGGGEKIPGYVNLGLTGEWRIDSRWSAWAEAGNLLGMAIERMPGFVEKAPSLTVGMSFKL